MLILLHIRLYILLYSLDLYRVSEIASFPITQFNFSFSF